MFFMDSFFDTALFTYGILPALIFLARVTDVAIGTIRIVMVARGHRILAPVLGFFEILIWLLAIGKIMQNLDNWICYVAYSAGFATGNYVGLLIEKKLAMGVIKIQIITQNPAVELIARFKEEKLGITYHDAFGRNSTKVSIIHSIIKRHNLSQVVKWIQEYNPKAFYSIEDIRFVSKGLFPIAKHTRWRKGK